MIALNNQLYRKLRIIPLTLIFVSIFIIGINLVREYESVYKNNYENDAEIDKTISESYNEQENIVFLTDLNSASYVELMSIPGVGEKTAEKIIEFRVDTGGFESVKELLLLEGMSEAKYQKILPYVTVANAAK